MRLDLKRVREVIEPIVTPLGYELIDIKYLSEVGRWVLRVLVEGKNGISVGDCQKISREIETPLEVEEFLPANYRLEVSSPGLDRPLVKEEDYHRFVGKRAAIKTEEPINGRRNFKGFWQGFEDGNILMEIDNESFRIPFVGVKKAHLVFEGRKKGN